MGDFFLCVLPIVWIKDSPLYLTALRTLGWFRLRVKVESTLWVTSDKDISYLVYSAGLVHFFI
jgi:hypothetical protein